jgi:hypothetical protein
MALYLIDNLSGYKDVVSLLTKSGKHELTRICAV